MKAGQLMEKRSIFGRIVALTKKTKRDLTMRIGNGELLICLSGEMMERSEDFFFACFFEFRHFPYTRRSSTLKKNGQFN